MMKRILLSIISLFAVGLILSVSNLYAFPVIGTVDPGFDSGYNLATSTTGTATYKFKNLASPNNWSISGLTLQFEGDVFDLAHTAPLAGSLNPGWSFSTLSAGTYRIESFSGPAIPEGSALSFDVNFTLLDDALTLDPLWDEGGYWQQGFGVQYSDSNGTLVPLPFGGSTAPIPEPGTMVLLGISTLSLAGYGRMRLRK